MDRLVAGFRTSDSTLRETYPLQGDHGFPLLSYAVVRGGRWRPRRGSSASEQDFGAQYTGLGALHGRESWGIAVALLAYTVGPV